MKVFKWILIGLFVLTIGGGIYYFLNKKKKEVDLTIDGYTPDETLRLEVQGRKIQVSKSTSVDFIASLDGSESIPAYVGGTFPMTKIVEKPTAKKPNPTFAASERPANKKLIQNLINKYDKLVTSASERFSIPRLFIYIVMAVENTIGDVESGKDGTYVGLMQISAGNAADTLATQKKRRLLTVDDLTYFKNKFGSAVFTNSSAVENKDLINAEININVGTLHLSEQIIDNKFDINTDLHKILISYNRGKNRLDNDGTKSLGIDAMINHYLKDKTHYIGANYIIRALGPHGVADILVNDLGITN